MFLRPLHNKGGKTDPDQFSDQEILFQYQKDRDTEWMAILFERYTHLVFGVCLKYLKNEEDSKDAVMQIFENLITDLLNHKVENFKSWLYTITKNHCLMELRKNKTAGKYKEAEFSKLRNEIMEFTEDIHHNNEKDLDELLEKLSNGIGMLSEEQSACIKLMYLEEKSYKEIASLTGYHIKSVKSYIQNGKRNLRKILNEGNGSFEKQQNSF